MKTHEFVNDIKVGGKTPEEIKRGLKCCSKIEGCKNGGCSYYDLGSGSICIPAMTGDALAYIQQLESDNDAKQKRIEELESRLARVEREKDAAVADLKDEGNCYYCKNRDLAAQCDFGSCIDCGNEECPCFRCDRMKNHFEWRGVCPGKNT